MEVNFSKRQIDGIPLFPGVPRPRKQEAAPTASAYISAAQSLNAPAVGAAMYHWSMWNILRIRPHSALGNFTTTTRMKTPPFPAAG